jgi:hypothetical protein
MDLREHGTRAARRRWDRPENVQLRVDALAEYVARVVSTLPPLTAEQRELLAALFAPATRTPE